MVTVNDPAAPIANVVLAALVIAGAWWTFSVKLCVVLPELFVAVKVMACAPAVPAAGVPLSVPVPLPLSMNVTPPGNAPVEVIDAVGVPTVVTVKVPRLPTVNVVLVALVNARGIVDRQREGLGRARRVGAVLAVKRDGVGAGRPGRRRAAERPGAVAVVDPRDPGRQRRAGAGDGWARGIRSW